MTGPQKGARSRPLPDVDSAHSAREKITLALTLRQSDPSRARTRYYLFVLRIAATGSYFLSATTNTPGDGWVRFATEMAPHALHLNCNWLRFFLGTFSIYSATGHEWWVFYGHDEKYFQPQDSRCAKESDGPALFFAGQRILALSHTQRGLQPHGD
jgi:hypothetical protein